MDVRQHIKMFNLIAPIYGWFFSFQVKNYQRLVDQNLSYFQNCTSLLDIGCGTGALCSVLSEHGWPVTGLDGSLRMIKQAQRLNQENTAIFKVCNALEIDPLEQKYDIIIASYVLHGLQQEQRQQLYRQMKRLAHKRIIIMDYNQNRSFLTSAIEWLEHGDYFNFIQSAESEMRAIFPNVRIVQTGKRAAWYVCDCH